MRFEMVMVLVMVVGFTLLFVGAGIMVSVPAGHLGVPVTLGKVESYTLSEGFHWKNPLTSVVKIEVRTLKMKMSESSASKDLQEVTTEVAVNYRIVGDKINLFHKEVGTDYLSRIVEPAIQEAVKSATANYNAKDLIQNRNMVKQDIETSLRERLTKYYLEVDSVSITNFQFGVEFDKAIEEKVIADQNRQKAIINLELIKIEAEQAIAKAEGEASALIATARGEAQAINIVDRELKNSPLYLDYLAVTTWNGELPLATGGAMPFLNIQGD